MIVKSLQETVEELDAAFNRGDLEAIVNFYEDEAVMVVEPGRLARGKAELRDIFAKLLRWQGIARQEKTHVIESGDMALFISKWSFSYTSADGELITRESIATSVFRCSADGQWKLVIDNSYGPAVLE
jgi:uncharacterized protein (TIGR02246 family)